MGRARRSEQQAGWHHVVNRGADRRTIFVDDADRLDFGRLLARAHDRTGVSVIAYCLMSNHFHLVLDCPAGGLSEFVQLVTGPFTRHSNERRGADGAVLRGRFASRPISTPEYLVAAVRYVHRNPLAFAGPDGLVTYRWSSHRTYLGLRPCPVWLDPFDVLRWLGGVDAFDRFVRGEGAIFEPPPATSLVDEALAAAQLIAHEHADALDRAPQGLARTLVTSLLDAVGDDVADELCRRLRYRTPDGLARARRRVEHALAVDPALALAVATLSEVLGLDKVVSDTTL
jgi:putative transposase